MNEPQSHRGEKSGGKSLYSGDGDPRVRGDDGVDRTEVVCLVPTVLRGNKKVCEAELWGTSAFPNEISERGRKEGKERLTLPPSFPRKRESPSPEYMQETAAFSLRSKRNLSRISFTFHSLPILFLPALLFSLCSLCLCGNISFKKYINEKAWQQNPKKRRGIPGLKETAP